MSCLHVRDDDPDLLRGEPPLLPSRSRQRKRSREPRHLEELRSVAVGHAKPNAHQRRHRYGYVGRPPTRSEERRVGKACVSTLNSRWSTANEKPKQNNTKIQ